MCVHLNIVPMGISPMGNLGCFPQGKPAETYFFVSFVADGVRKQYPGATDAAIREAIASWLSGSRDRDGGKKEREAAEIETVGKRRGRQPR